MLRLLIWIVAAVSLPFFLGGSLYGPSDLGFENRSPRQVIGPVRAQLQQNHGWLQEKLAKVENTLEDAHQFVTRATDEFKKTAQVLWTDGVPYLKERLRRPLPVASRTDAAE